MLFRSHRDIPARFGIIPRYGQASDIKWFEAEPCYILHVINCWEEGDWVHQVCCRQPNPDAKRDKKDGSLASMMAYRRRVHELYKWSFNMVTGEVREGRIDDLNTEFPKINPLRMGRKSRLAFNQFLPLPRDGEISGQCQTFDALVRYNTDTGAYQRWNYGEGVHGNEAPIAPKKGATASNAEDDAYAVTFVTDTNTWQSACLVFDAKDISRGPIARVKIPHRIAAGFHSVWIPGEQIYQ